MTDTVQDTTQETTQAPAQDAQQDQSNDLTINDLAAMKNIIDLGSQRGAFKPNEMVAVGTIYNKLTNFLEQVQKQADAQKAQG
jgi:hypothetical protein